ncbi:response regulator transcription factor [Ferrimonas marina]|uniref:Phosphate regulon transcriptional regulatory protein PhoB n=1 Tax=Ferrimonas marina TaxID=299255 RepID=A0A1M5S8E5_9GAMM|nr:response regulator transcription factor [Ferrimonas marina]SHH34715.1 DNA-binding response regulator, OmpR family, contains REC and winged-helix (wHTH) domain [Ferrimonas marina]
MADLLVIEDEQDINALITMNLESLNHRVTSCDDGRRGYELASNQRFDLIVLDLMLPGMDGLSLCQQLRQHGCHTPILMLTARNSELDRVVGLESGADDYLTKPFSVRELQARVKAHLRRAQLTVPPPEPEPAALRRGPLTLDAGRRACELNGKAVELTGTEFDLLWYLSQHPGRVYRRDDLLSAVWGYQHNGYQHTVNSHINRLRAKLEQDPAHPELVLTVWGVGYKFNDQI